MRCFSGSLKSGHIKNIPLKLFALFSSPPPPHYWCNNKNLFKNIITWHRFVKLVIIFDKYFSQCIPWTRTTSPRSNIYSLLQSGLASEFMWYRQLSKICKELWGIVEIIFDTIRAPISLVSTSESSKKKNSLSFFIIEQRAQIYSKLQFVFPHFQFN